MNALFVRIGVDQAYGSWNSPIGAEDASCTCPFRRNPARLS